MKIKPLFCAFHVNIFPNQMYQTSSSAIMMKNKIVAGYFKFILAIFKYVERKLIYFLFKSQMKIKNFQSQFDFSLKFPHLKFFFSL